MSCIFQILVFFVGFLKQHLFTFCLFVLIVVPTWLCWIIPLTQQNQASQQRLLNKLAPKCCTVCPSLILKCYKCYTETVVQTGCWLSCYSTRIKWPTSATLLKLPFIVQKSWPRTLKSFLYHIFDILWFIAVVFLKCVRMYAAYFYRLLLHYKTKCISPWGLLACLLWRFILLYSTKKND